MSGQATGWVLRNGPRPDSIDRNGKKYGSRARGMRAVLIGVGDSANGDGRHSHPGSDNLCMFSLYGRRQVSTLLAELVAECWLEVEEEGGGRGKATVYRLPLMGLESEHSLHGFDERFRAIHGDEPRSPEPQTAHSETQTAHSKAARQQGSNGDTNVESNVAATPLDSWPENLPAVVVESGLLDQARELCLQLEATLVERGFVDVAGKAIGKRWLLDMEALLRVDERPPAQVRWVIAWLARGDDRVASFWRSNIRSPAKLRQQWAVMREQYHNLTRSMQSRTGQQFDRAMRDAGHDPSEVAADGDALVRSMFGSDAESDESKPLTSGVLDVESREESP